MPIAATTAFVMHRPNELTFFILFDPACHKPTDFTVVDDHSRVGMPGLTTATSNLRNHLTNSRFAAEQPICWGQGDGEARFQPVETNFSDEFSLADAGVACVFLGLDRRHVTLIHGRAEEGELTLPVSPGQPYAFSGYFATHRCRGRMEIVFRNEARQALARHEAEIGADIVGGRTLDRYRRVGVIAAAPAGASAACLRIVATRTRPDQDGFFFMALPWFGGCPDRILPPWSASPSDLAEAQGDAGFTARGFESLAVPIPLDCLDGSPHSIQVLQRQSGRPLAGSPLTIRRRLDISGEIDRVSGDLVIGRILVGGGQAPIALELQVDGEAVSEGLAMGDGSARPFSLTLPPRLCDARPHVFGIAVKATGLVVARYPALAPALVTPLDALRTYAGMPIDASLSPAARARYRGLLDHLELCADRQTGALVKSLHDILLRGPDDRSPRRRLEFPPVGQPLVSVIVPVHNMFAITYVCLAALLFAANRASFEVIVVDDGSTDETGDIAQLVTGIKLVRHRQASGFVQACNDGAAAARGDYLVFLNNDTEVTSRWLDEMLFVFRSFDTIGLVGAKLLNADGSLQEAGGIVWSNGNPWNYGRGQNPAAPASSYLRQVDYVSGAAMMVSRQVWDQAGGFSRAFMPAYFEDTDLAFKVRDLGLKVVFTPFASVYHFEGGTAGTDPAAGAKRHQDINRPKFKRKWLRALRAQGAEGDDPDRARDRNIALRALMIDFEVPRLDVDAGSYAAIQEIRALQALGFKITFLPTNFAYLGRHTEQLQRIGVECVYAPFCNSVDSLLADRGGEFDLVYVTRYRVAAQVFPAARRHAPRAKLVVNLADLHFLREIRTALARDDPAAMQRALEIREAELETLGGVDLALTYSAVEEAVILSHNLDRTRVARLPWIAEPQTEVPPFAARRGVSFIGGFRHPPNAEAMDFFTRQIWPRLECELPETTFNIYGSSITPAQRARWSSERVVVHGQIDDIRQMFDSTRVVVAPLLSGAGVKGKVFDGLAAGVPSVLSPLAAEGTGVRDGLEVTIATTPEQWVAGVRKLYTDQAAWATMSAAATDFIARYHGFDRGVEIIRSALDEVGLPCRRDSSFLFANCCRPIF